MYFMALEYAFRNAKTCSLNSTKNWKHAVQNKTYKKRFFIFSYFYYILIFNFRIYTSLYECIK